MTQAAKMSEKSGGSLFSKIIGSLSKGSNKPTPASSVTKETINSARVFGLGEARKMGGISTREAIALIQRNSEMFNESSEKEAVEIDQAQLFSASRMRDKPIQMVGARSGSDALGVTVNQSSRFDAKSNVFPNSDGKLIAEPPKEQQGQEIAQKVEALEKKARIKRAKDIAKDSGYEAAATLVRCLVKHSAGAVASSDEERIKKMVLGDGKERFSLRIDAEALSFDTTPVVDDLVVAVTKKDKKYSKKSVGEFEPGEVLMTTPCNPTDSKLFVSRNLPAIKLISSWLLSSSVKKQAALAVQPSYLRVDDDRPHCELFFVQGTRAGQANGHSIMKTRDTLTNTGGFCKSITHVFRSKLVVRSTDKHFSFHQIEKRSFELPCFYGWNSPCEKKTSGSNVVNQIESFLFNVATLSGEYLSKSIEQASVLAKALKASGKDVSTAGLGSLNLSLNERFDLYRSHGALYSDSLVELLQCTVQFRGKQGSLGQLLAAGVEPENGELSHGLFCGDYSFGLILAHALMICQEAKSVSNKAYLVLALLDRLIRTSDLIRGKGALSDESQGEEVSELRSFLLAESQTQIKNTASSDSILGASVVFIGASGGAKDVLNIQNRASLPASELVFLCRNMSSIRKMLIKEGVLFKDLESSVKTLISI